MRRLTTVCEMTAFVRKAEKLWTREEHDEFIDFIAQNPDAGDIIEGTGGARKVRWARAGMGKRGGTRIITYFHDETMPVFLFMLFAKNERSDIGPGDKRDLATAIAGLKAQRRTRRLS
jgi:hypothetical protein